VTLEVAGSRPVVWNAPGPCAPRSSPSGSAWPCCRHCGGSVDARAGLL